MNDGVDLDANEVEAENGCAWTKWVYIVGFGVKTQKLCGVEKWGELRKTHNLTDLKK